MAGNAQSPDLIQPHTDMERWNQPDVAHWQTALPALHIQTQLSLLAEGSCSFSLPTNVS